MKKLTKEENEVLDARIEHGDAPFEAMRTRVAFSFVDEGGTLVNAPSLFQPSKEVSNG